ncbi:hypothetical protein [Streptomyces sp. NRRL S-920]|uniref:hypothetical protein n=1 Tax=Streptomyces sp. NRRL S-920 TaxID=1463921 RepID=UPI000AA0D5BC|nr:hypothetical protein [Streptomyces sp. NRRL S-920]
MATDTAPPIPAGSPEPPAAPAASTAPAPAADTGIMAALMAAVEPARPVTATGAGARPDGDDPAAKADPDGVVDRSSPGVTSEQFKAPQDLTGAGSDAAGAQHKEGVFKTLIRAGATRWAKGGGTANKRLDLEKAKASAHQVKEARTTTVTKSPGLPTRNGSGGTGGGGRNSGGSSGGNSGRNSTGNGATGTGRGGATGGGGRGSSGSNGNGGSGGGRGTSGNGGGGSPKDTSPKGAKDSGGKGKDGSSGNAGSSGKAGKDGKAGASGSGGGSTSGGSSGSSKDKADKGKGDKVDLKKDGGGGQGSGGSSGSSGGSGKNGSSGKSGGSGTSGASGSGGGSGSSGGSGKNGGSGHSSNGTDTRTPLQRSREVGHGDGSAVRNAVDHVKAYAQGTKDGYQDKKEENAKEHARLDQARTDHKAKTQDPKQDDPKQQGTAVTGPSGHTIVIAPPDEGDDGVSTDVKPLLVKEIDANTLTLGGAARGSISRKELRNFKQYERKLEAKENHLIKVADACKSLEAAAEDEAKDCQDLAEQAKAVEGGEKLAAKLTKLADAAKAQATEAAELHKRAKRAAEMCKVVLTNIGTRYAPLYKAVVDSDETKPAELRFYNDKGSYAPAA